MPRISNEHAQTIANIVGLVDRFDAASDAAEYTDISDMWDLLETIRFRLDSIVEDMPDVVRSSSLKDWYSAFTERAEEEEVDRWRYAGAQDIPQLVPDPAPKVETLP